MAHARAQKRKLSVETALAGVLCIGLLGAVVLWPEQPTYERPFSPAEKVRHALAKPNCSAARDLLTDVKCPTVETSPSPLAAFSNVRRLSGYELFDFKLSRDGHIGFLQPPHLSDNSLRPVDFVVPPRGRVIRSHVIK